MTFTHQRAILAIARHSVAIVVCISLTVLASCRGDLGLPCDVEGSDELSAVERAPGKDNIVSDVRFECDSALCMSQNASEPFCTRRCESDFECGDAPGFVCAQVILFGAEGCLDHQSNPDCIDDDGSRSDLPIRHCVRL